MLNESLVKYLAGLLDADGSLSFLFVSNRAGDGYNMGMLLRLSASPVVDRHGFLVSLPSLTGMGFVHRSTEDGRERVSWHITNGSELQMLVPRLVKHMVIKARHWQWMLELFREHRRRKYGDRTLSLAQCDELRQRSKHSRITNVGPLKAKNHPTWAWLAGYLDGDGCYTFDSLKGRKQPRPGYAMRVSAVAHANDACVLEFIHSAFGGTFTDFHQAPHLKLWYRNVGVSDRSFALRFLPRLAKHSRLKRHKIDQMIAYHHQQRLTAPTPAGEVIV